MTPQSRVTRVDSFLEISQSEILGRGAAFGGGFDGHSQAWLPNATPVQVLPGNALAEALLPDRRQSLVIGMTPQSRVTRVDSFLEISQSEILGRGAAFGSSFDGNSQAWLPNATPVQVEGEVVQLCSFVPICHPR
jgi:hypothetical protein